MGFNFEIGGAGVIILSSCELYGWAFISKTPDSLDCFCLRRIPMSVDECVVGNVLAMAMMGSVLIVLCCMLESPTTLGNAGQVHGW